MNNTIIITTQHAEQILAEALNSIKDAVDDVKDLKDEVTEKIKQTGEEALKPITDAKVKHCKL